MERDLNLCDTCTHSGQCPLENRSSERIVCCDWYRMVSDIRIKSGDDSRPVSEETDTTGRDTQYHGLCATCSKRFSCPLSQTDGGVWRCGDYC